MRAVRKVEPDVQTTHAEVNLVQFIRGKWLNLFLLLVPVSIAVELLQLPKLWLFVAASLAVIPLAGLIGDATEELAHRVGPVAGGLLNATFGNAPELIIALFALQAGLQEVVKASITGSIVGNILLVLGASMLIGGWGRDKQRFNRTSAGASISMLVLAVAALVMPAVFDLTVFGNLEESSPSIERFSLLVAIVLMATYFASLVFSLRTHRDLFTSVPDEGEEEAGPLLSLRDATILLLAASAIVAVEAELMVEAIHEATAALGMTEFFVGVIVVAIVGNAAEHSSAVMLAMKNKMDISVTIATGSSTQIALFVAPVLVFASVLFGQPMSLVFNGFEIAAIFLSVIVLSVVTLDGESNWFEGLQLLAVYLVLAIVFFFVPVR